MKTAWWKRLILGVAAVYLAATSLGHCFHNHGAGGKNAHACAAHCHGHCVIGCHEHADPAEDAWRSTLVETVVAAHVCPVCDFFSHHGVPAGNDALPACGRLKEHVGGAGFPVVVRLCPGPQQPRAPPRVA